MCVSSVVVVVNGEAGDKSAGTKHIDKTTVNTVLATIQPRHVP